MRVGEFQGGSRFVVDLNEAIDFKVYTLADPYRVVIDTPEMEWSEPGLRKAAGVIKTLRYGLFKQGVGRIVLDVAVPVTVKSAFVIPPREGAGWRFVLDMQETTRDAFMRTQGGGTPVHMSAAVQAAPQAASLQVPLPPQPAISAPMPVPEAKTKAKAANAKPVVVIDPGHGGVDPGAIGVSGIYEKFITLSVAKDVKAALEKTGRFKVVLTRDRDIFIPLRERVGIGRNAGADLFISLHADAVQNPSIRGLSVYTLSQNASDAEAQALADKENKADLIGGMDLSHESAEVTNILIDLAQRETMNLSAGFAGDVIDELGRETRLLGNTHRFAGFAVLKAPDVPSILVELGYLSNEPEEEQLRQPKYRAKLATALARSVDRYFAQTQKAKRP